MQLWGGCQPGGVSQLWGGGAPHPHKPQLQCRRDSMRPIRLTVALGLKWFPTPSPTSHCRKGESLDISLRLFSRQMTPDKEDNGTTIWNRRECVGLSCRKEQRVRSRLRCQFSVTNYDTRTATKYRRCSANSNPVCFMFCHRHNGKSNPLIINVTPDRGEQPCSSINNHLTFHWPLFIRHQVFLHAKS